MLTTQKKKFRAETPNITKKEMEENIIEDHQTKTEINPMEKK